MTDTRTAPFSRTTWRGSTGLHPTAAVVEGPPELRNIVAEYWPHLLHKVKPPRELMH